MRTYTVLLHKGKDGNGRCKTVLCNGNNEFDAMGRAEALTGYYAEFAIEDMTDTIN